MWVMCDLFPMSCNLGYMLRVSKFRKTSSWSAFIKTDYEHIHAESLCQYCQGVQSIRGIHGVQGIQGIQGSSNKDSF